MRVVGIKQLKAKLSEYLRDVKRGEVILVTDRDRVVAELRPPASNVVPPSDRVEEVLDALVQKGDVQPARVPKGDWTWKPAGGGFPAGTAMRVLDELREDREGDA